MAFRANSFKFLWRTVNSKPPTMPFGVVAGTFPTTFLEIAVYKLLLYWYRSTTVRSGTTQRFIAVDQLLFNILAFKEPISHEPKCTLCTTQNFAQPLSSISPGTTQEKLETMVLQIFGGKQGALWSMCPYQEPITRLLPLCVFTSNEQIWLPSLVLKL